MGRGGLGGGLGGRGWVRGAEVRGLRYGGKGISTCVGLCGLHTVCKVTDCVFCDSSTNIDVGQLGHSGPVLKVTKS